MIDTGAGVVDADYRGVVFVLLFNHSDTDFEGMRLSLAFGQSQRHDVSSGRRPCGTADSRENLYTRRGRGSSRITCASLALRTKRDVISGFGWYFARCWWLWFDRRPRSAVKSSQGSRSCRQSSVLHISCSSVPYVAYKPHTPTLIVQHTKHTIRDLPALRAAFWPSQAASCGA
jgi:hypothetical protein